MRFALLLLLAGCSSTIADEVPPVDYELENALAWIDEQASKPKPEPEDEDEKGSAGATGQTPEPPAEPAKSQPKELSRRFLMLGFASCGPCRAWHQTHDEPMRAANWTIGPEPWNLIQTIDVGDNPEAITKWKVTQFPTFILIDDGKEVARHVNNEIDSYGLARMYRGETMSIPRSSSRWTHPGNTKAELIQHLLADGIHRNKFNRQQLETLSYQQLEQLHSADHEGRVVRQRSYCPTCPR